MEHIQIESSSKHCETLSNEKQYIIDLNNTKCLLKITSSSSSIKFELKPELKSFYYEKIFSLEDLININKIFVAFDSIETLRKSFEEIIEKKKYSIQEKSRDVEIILKVQIFEKLIDINLILERTKIGQEKLNEILYEEIKGLKEEIKKVKEENNELKIINNNFKKEIEKLNNTNGLLFELYSKVVSRFNDLFYEVRDKLNFRFANSKNYSITYNGLIATKLFNNDWSSSILGDNEVPDNRLSHWRIRLNKIIESKENTWHILIGIGPFYDSSYLFHHKCWSFIVGKCELCLRQEKPTPYNIEKKKRLNEGDIIEVIVDRQKGELSFKVNGEDFGIAAKDIPKEGQLFPFVSMYEAGQIVEIL